MQVYCKIRAPPERLCLAADKLNYMLKLDENYLQFIMHKVGVGDGVVGDSVPACTICALPNEHPTSTHKHPRSTRGSRSMYMF